MELNIQILSFLFSFLFGIFFYILLEVNTKFLYHSSVFIKVLFSFIFILFSSLVYFYILLKINNGYVHFYFFICIVVGYFLCKVIYKRLLKRKRVWYTYKWIVGDNYGQKEKEIFC